MKIESFTPSKLESMEEKIYLMLAVQIPLNVDRKVQLCNELCKKRKLIIKIKFELFLSIRRTHTKTLHWYRRPYVPKIIVSSGISSMKHLRSVSLMWKYKADEKLTTNVATTNNTISVFNIFPFLLLN